MGGVFRRAHPSLQPFPQGRGAIGWVPAGGPLAPLVTKAQMRTDACCSMVGDEGRDSRLRENDIGGAGFHVKSELWIEEIATVGYCLPRNDNWGDVM